MDSVEEEKSDSGQSGILKRKMGMNIFRHSQKKL